MRDDKKVPREKKTTVPSSYCTGDQDDVEECLATAYRSFFEYDARDIVWKSIEGKICHDGRTVIERMPCGK